MRQLPVMVILQKPLRPPFERVQTPSRKQSDFIRFFRRIQGGQHIEELLPLACWQSARVAILEQALERFLPEALDGHPGPIVHCQMTFDKRLCGKTESSDK